MLRQLIVSGIVAVLLLGCDASEDNQETLSEGLQAPVLSDLGGQHYAVTTSSAQAQQFFDQGLALIYGYQRADAAAAFSEAGRLDPNCAMCFWGVAIAQGPYPNGPLTAAGNEAALNALERAGANSANATAKEKDFIEALRARYAKGVVGERQALDQAFVDAMRELVKAWPDDDEAVMLLVEALMTRTPWNYWLDPEQANPIAAEAISLSEMVLERNPEHIGAIHYLIHLTEASSNPGRAEKGADQLAALAPGLHHLVHMPGHTFLRLGRYNDAIQTNFASMAAIESFNQSLQAQDFESAIVPLHAVDFIHAGSMMIGHSGNALFASDELLLMTNDQSTQGYPRIAILKEARLLTYLRFGMWSEIQAVMGPMADTQFSDGIYHLAMGVASVKRGQIDLGRNELVALRVNLASLAGQGSNVFPAMPMAKLLKIAENELKATIAGADGQLDEAVDLLEEAVAIQDDLYYIEPPHWYMPVRQRLGAALIEAERFEEARDVYLKDLSLWPDNGWSLKGLSIALAALQDTAGAEAANTAFEKAWKSADIEISASAF